jgi:hypothetical protein
MFNSSDVNYSSICKFPNTLHLEVRTFLNLTPHSFCAVHCKKRLAIFRPQPRCHQTKLSLAGIIKFSPARESLTNDILAGTGNSLTFYYSALY